MLQVLPEFLLQTSITMAFWIISYFSNRWCEMKWGLTFLLTIMSYDYGIWFSFPFFFATIVLNFCQIPLSRLHFMTSYLNKLTCIVATLWWWWAKIHLPLSCLLPCKTWPSWFWILPRLTFHLTGPWRSLPMYPWSWGCWVCVSVKLSAVCHVFLESGFSVELHLIELISELWRVSVKV